VSDDTGNRRRRRCVRGVRESRLAGRPHDRGVAIDEFAAEVIGRVAYGGELRGRFGLPAHVERNDRGNRRDGGLGEAGRVEDVGVVRHRHVVGMHSGRAIVQVGGDPTAWERRGPEQPVDVDTRVEIVNLIWRGQLPIKQVESNEAEGALAMASVDSDILAAHEAHVGVVGQRLASIVHAAALDLGRRHGTLEVGDGRDFLAVRGKEEVKDFPVCLKDQEL